MCFQTPSVPSPGDVTSQTLAAQLKSAPQILAANQEYGPQYSALSLKNLSTFLNGVPGQPGFLDEYQNTMMPALTNAANAANTSTRTATVNDATQLAPSLMALARSSNPGGASLLDTLTSNTSRDLGYGTELTPAEKVQLRQSVRGGQASRGMGFSPGDVFNESMAQTGFGQNLYQQRMGAAQNLIPQIQGFYGNPLSEVAGTGSNAGMTASSMGQMASGNAAPAMSGQFNGQNALASQYMNDMGQASAVGANANNELMMGLSKSATGLASGAISSY